MSEKIDYTWRSKCLICETSMGACAGYNFKRHGSTNIARSDLHPRFKKHINVTKIQEIVVCTSCLADRGVVL
tara:strand:+ start:1015 stop:1230 length:216 start_codon:yes stop_codon:yes gene_type:complete